MNVILVQVQVDYEGNSTVHIASSQEEAESWAKRHPEAFLFGDIVYQSAQVNGEEPLA